MSHVVLGLLIIVGPQTIYTLNKLFQEGVSLFYAASLGSLRSALARLLEDGAVTYTESTSNGRAKKTYSITPHGRTVFHEWMLSPLTERDLDTAALSRLYFLGAIDEPGERRRILDGISARAAEDHTRLQQLARLVDGTHIPDEYADLAHYQRQTLEYGLQSLAHGRDFFAHLRDTASDD